MGWGGGGGGAGVCILVTMKYEQIKCDMWFYFKGSGPEWYISSMFYCPDIYHSGPEPLTCSIGRQSSLPVGDENLSMKCLDPQEQEMVTSSVLHRCMAFTTFTILIKFYCKQLNKEHCSCDAFICFLPFSKSFCERDCNEVICTFPLSTNQHAAFWQPTVNL